MKEIELTGEEIDAQGKGLARDVEASFEELQAILERHKNRLLNEVKEKVQQKKANLNVQKKIFPWLEPRFIVSQSTPHTVCSIAPTMRS